MSNENRPFVEAKPGDPITAGKWNELQTKVRAELHAHGHTGAWKDGLFDGEPVGREGIQDRAINGDKVDPASQLSVAGLAVDAVSVGRTATGTVQIRGDKAMLELGAGLVKQGDAGKIAYQRWTNGLDIVGAGTDSTNRRITFFAEGGSTHNGPLNVTTALTAASATFTSTVTAGGPLRITGGNWDVGGSEGDLRVGNDTYRLKVGVALGGGGAGDVRIRAVGGTNRLFVGAGTADTLTITQSDLSVSGTFSATIPGGAGAWAKFAVTAEGFWGDTGNRHVTIGAGGGGGVMLQNPHVSWFGAENRASIRYGRTGGGAGKTYWDVGLRADGGFGFQSIDDGAGGEQVKIDKTGTLRANAGISVGSGNRSDHVNEDGAFYRMGGNVYLTVDDNLYIRDTDGTNRMRFETNAGSLTVTGNGGLLNLEGTNHGYVQFYPMGMGSGRKGWFGYGSPNGTTLGLSNDWGELQLTGTTVRTSANLATGGALYVGGSDIYFTQTNHNHTGIGNATGYAAIENAENYGALMILGRQTASGRIVKVWDELGIPNGVLRLGSWSIVASGAGLYFQYNGANVLRMGADWDKMQIYRNSNGAAPYWYFNTNGAAGVYNG